MPQATWPNGATPIAATVLPDVSGAAVSCYRQLFGPTRNPGEAIHMLTRRAWILVVCRGLLRLFGVRAEREEIG